ncbi:MAG: DUF1549 domain-containing protein [Planctomycetia bacterium]|nr:DUF1549 domain-containing protein [Planctomycetia bacterium]
MHNLRFRGFVTRGSRAAAWVLVTTLLTGAVDAVAAESVDFVHDVVPLLKRHCAECHLGDARQGGFSMNTREAILAGGDSGTAGLLARDSASSELIARVTSTDPDFRMPSDGPPLPEEAVAVLRRWIDEGAVWEEGFAFSGTAWEPPLRLAAVTLPPPRDGRTNPVDRIVDAYHAARGRVPAPRCDDRTFIRRASLDLVGLLPDPDRVAAFVADGDPGKRAGLVRELLGDRVAYAEHWMTFWNDLLRNDYAGTGFITGGRRQITTWLHRALVDDMPYDRFVRELIAPGEASRGFLDGIVWRGVVNASQTVPIQFAQNVGQSFLGINLKCASCHDSFVDRWTLAQTYELAAVAADAPLELHRCDKATGVKATPGWLFSELGRVDPAAPRAERLRQLAALVTDPANGWLSRTLVNRLWHRLMGRGIVHPVDSLRTAPWSAELLDILAAELVTHEWSVTHVLETIATSEAYGAVTPGVEAPAGGDFDFVGPLPRRMTAEQFTDAVWQLTGTAPPRGDAEVVRVVTAAAAETPPPSPPTARWIWSNERAEAAPGAKIALRRSFTLAEPAAHAVLVVACDNACTVFVNGRSVATAADWATPTWQPVAAALRKGANEIVVVAENGSAGGPAALRLELRARLVDGTDLALATDGPAGDGGVGWEWTETLPNARGQYPKDKAPTDWRPAVVAANQGIWAGSDAAFATSVAMAAVHGDMPMVRAALVKATPLMAALGRPNRDQVVTSRPTDLTTLEAILLANEQSLADVFAAGGGRILAAHGPGADALRDWLFPAALSRPATPEEAEVVHALLGDEPTAERVADCVWAVVMLPEFQFIR